MIRKEKKSNYILYIVTVFFMISCGYYSYKGSIPAHIKSIYISPVNNKSVEENIENDIYSSVVDIIVSENIIKLDSENYDSQLDITISNVQDVVETYSSESGSSIEKVDEWSFKVEAHVIWYDLKDGTEIVSEKITEEAIYGLDDMSSDGIDNDEDGQLDSNDPDEVGSGRIGAKKIAYEKISRSVINLLLSTW